MSHYEDVYTDGLLSVASTRYGDDVVVITLTGELDRSNVAGAERLIGDLAENGDDLIVLDLSSLEFLDSSGVAMLIAAHNARKGRESLRIVPSRSFAVTHVLRLTGIDSMIDISWERPGSPPSASPFA